MFEKLTYSGTECNNYIYFSFDGEYFDTELVTEELRIEPSSIKIKKKPVPKFTSWKYQINAGKDVDLVNYIKRLIDVFEPKIDAINRLKKEMKLETNLQFVIDIDINPKMSTPIFSLNKRIIHFLSQTETEVDFDLYKTDSIGSLTKL